MYVHVLACKRKESNMPNALPTLIVPLYKTTAHVCQHIIVRIVPISMLYWWCVCQTVPICLLKISHKSKKVPMINFKSIVPGLLGHPNESKEFFQTESKAC